jgi:hypothetical protein
VEAVQFFTDARQALNQLLDSDATADAGDLRAIQKMLLDCSMPAWRARHHEFRQRRLKRRLRRYAQRS